MADVGNPQYWRQLRWRFIERSKCIWCGSDPFFTASWNIENPDRQQKVMPAKRMYFEQMGVVACQGECAANLERVHQELGMVVAWAYLAGRLHWPMDEDGDAGSNKIGPAEVTHGAHSS